MGLVNEYSIADGLRDVSGKPAEDLCVGLAADLKRTAGLKPHKEKELRAPKRYLIVF